MKLGSVVRYNGKHSFRYLQLVWVQPKAMEVWRVIDFSTSNPVDDSHDIVKQPTSYYVQVLGRALINDDRFAFVGVAPVRDRRPPFRRFVGTGWLVIDGDEEKFFKKPIDEAVARLSIDDAVTPGLVAARLDSGWLPMQDRETGVSDVLEIMRLRRAQKRPGFRTRFFLEFASALGASKAQIELKRRGYDTAAANDKRSLVISRAWSESDSLESVETFEREISSAAHEFGGALVGHETGG